MRGVEKAVEVIRERYRAAGENPDLYGPWSASMELSRELRERPDPTWHTHGKIVLFNVKEFWDEWGAVIQRAKKR